MASRATINHSMHPQHPLAEMESHAEFRCDGCMMRGTGKRFRCSTCNFNLHQHCATCPETLPSLLHPVHQLGLVLLGPPGTRQMEHFCNVCCERAQGLFYRCNACNFDVHPGCTRLPQQVSSFLHPVHQLSLVRLGPQGTSQMQHFCNVCRERAEGLFYRCNACNFDVHPGCTRLPQQVSHVMHRQHPLVLALQDQSPGSCLVCGDECAGGRYRCNLCSVDIHFPCLLASCQRFTTSSRARPYPGTVPFTSPPMNTTNHHYNPLYMGVSGPYPFPAPGFLNRFDVRRMMYGIIGRVVEGAIANMIFGGQDLSPPFS